MGFSLLKSGLYSILIPRVDNQGRISPIYLAIHSDELSS
jgi:hypothetical protein